MADFHVGDFRVRPSLNVIENGDRAQHLEPRSIEVLVALADRAPDVFPKRELIESVWGEAFVSDEVLTHAIWDLRKAFGDDANRPSFIQTIPKRGYRLIAPVETTAADSLPTTRVNRSVLARPAILGLALASILAVALWIAFRNEAAPRPTDQEPVLWLVNSSDAPPHPDLQRTLHKDLEAALAGAQGFQVNPTDKCPTVQVREAHCLEVTLESLGEGYEISALVRDPGTRESAWSPLELLTFDGSREGARDAARNLERQVRTYLNVIAMDVYDDPDLQPWFDLSRHQIEAVAAFLQGMSYTYRNQSGARVPLDEAARKDPDFVAPRLFRIPTLVAGGEDPDLLGRYLGDLERLYPSASPFELPMIQWALAFAEGDVPKQLKELRAALDLEEDNRILLFLLAVAQFDNDLEAAWKILSELADQEWRFLGLYNFSAASAILLDKLGEAQEDLEFAATRELVDPATFELLELLAIYNEDAVAEAEYRAAKERRSRETAEPWDSTAALCAPKLAELATEQERTEVAERLLAFVENPRESSD